MKLTADRIAVSLVEHLRTDEAFKVLDQTCAQGGDWGAGGCLLLAKALQQKYGGDLWALWAKGSPQHIVLRKGDSFLDGDGWSSANTLLSNWKKWEGETFELKPVMVDQISNEIPESDEDVERIKNYLDKR